MVYHEILCCEIKREKDKKVIRRCLLVCTYFKLTGNKYGCGRHKPDS